LESIFFNTLSRKLTVTVWLYEVRTEQRYREIFGYRVKKERERGGRERERPKG
jgi:hypothetical protein